MCRRGIEKLFLKCCQPAKNDEKEKLFLCMTANRTDTDRTFRWVPLNLAQRVDKVDKVPAHDKFTLTSPNTSYVRMIVGSETENEKH